MFLKAVDNREEVKVDLIRQGPGGGRPLPKSHDLNASVRRLTQPSMLHGSLAILCDAAFRHNYVAVRGWVLGCVRNETRRRLP